ncbi:MAG: hypothetical protein Q8R92_05855 [Deltaproteobacteria bacterium]|nr:hypothetical protein [Deltaproteobacteria bacterium]
MRTDRGRRGYAVMMALLVVAIVSAVGLAVADLVTQSRLISGSQDAATRAFYVAQGGLAFAKQELSHDVAWAGGADFTLGDGEVFDVVVSVVGPAERRVLSTGRVAGAERRIEALLSLGDPLIIGDESTNPGSWRER